MPDAFSSDSESHDAAWPRIVIVGAGISGLCLAMRLKTLGFDSLTILEKSHDIGGTWLDNTYPGCGCDVPSMLYSFSFALNTDWSRKYAPQAEILQYFRDCCERFAIRPHIQFGTAVSTARWDEDRSHWTVTTDAGETIDCDFFVSAVGQLSRPALPAIEGIDSFRGPAFHAARWDHAFDARDKRIAVIGNGASAVQIVPKLAHRARQVSVLQRSANWILHRHDHRYTRPWRWFYRWVPFAARLQRLLMYLFFELRILCYNRRTLLNNCFTAWARFRMRRAAPEKLHSQLIPQFPAGCKRVLLSNDYLQALHHENVQLVTDPIERITPEGIRTSTGDLPLDAIVYATGFKASEFLYPMEILGRDGIRLNETWKRRPLTYLGILAPEFPNFFMLYGPNTNLGHNSIIFMVECQVRFILRCLKLLARRDCGVLEVRRDATEEFDQMLQRHLRKKVWNGWVASWYKTDQGDITNNWCRSTLAYWWHTRKPAEEALQLSPRRDCRTVERTPVAR